MYFISLLREVILLEVRKIVGVKLFKSVSYLLEILENEMVIHFYVFASLFYYIINGDFLIGEGGIGNHLDMFVVLAGPRLDS